MGFYPQVIDISPGGTIRWENHSSQHHIVTSTEGANIPTHCLNGRGFLGNTPTIEANSGERIRWYVFNLDTGHEWHNFHLHNARWTFAGESIDVRSIGLILVNPELIKVSFKDECSFDTCFTYSIKIMALLTTIPDRAITPIIDVAEK